MDSPELLIEIKNTQPIELIDLTRSLIALCNQFNVHTSAISNSSEIREGKLYVKEIKTGSIILSLVELAIANNIPFIENMNSIITFAEQIKKVVNYFSKGEGEKPILTTADYKDYSSIMNPIAKDNSSQINFSTVINGNVNLYVSTDSVGANALQNRVKNEIGELKQIDITQPAYSKVLFYWNQTKADLKSKKGNKGKIDSISEKDLNVIFADDAIQKEMIKGDEHPYKSTYVVDVTIETVNNIPKAYKIIKLHEVIPEE